MNGTATVGGAANERGGAAPPTPVRPTHERLLEPLEEGVAAGPDESETEEIPNWLKPFNPDEEEAEGESGTLGSPGRWSASRMGRGRRRKSRRVKS